jgi:hypothetical protein
MNMKRKLANIVGSAILASSLIAPVPGAMASTFLGRIESLYITKESCSEITDFSLAPEVMQVDTGYFNETVTGGKSLIASARVFDPKTRDLVNDIESGKMDKELLNFLIEFYKHRRFQGYALKGMTRGEKQATIDALKKELAHAFKGKELPTPRYKELPIIFPRDLYLNAATVSDGEYRLFGRFQVNGILRCIDETDKLRHLSEERNSLSSRDEIINFYRSLNPSQFLAVYLRQQQGIVKRFVLYIEVNSLLKLED